MPKKPAPKSEPKPELVYEIEGAPPKLFVVWSGALEHFLANEAGGWTPFLLSAATFAEAKALELAGETFTVRPIGDVVREQVSGANPVVLQAIAALGAR